MADVARKWVRIADILRQDIERGAYQYGDQLPTIAILKERFGVNRHTVRRALDALQNMGMVSMQQGRGSFVTLEPLTLKPAERLALSLIQARMLDRNWAEQPQHSVQTTRIERIPADETLSSLMACELEQTLWHVQQTYDKANETMAMSQHYLLARQFPDLKDQIESLSISLGSYLDTALKTELHFSGFEIQALHAQSSRAVIFGLKETDPMLVLLGLELDCKSKNPVHFRKIFLAADKVYLKET